MQTLSPADPPVPGAGITLGNFDGLHRAHQHIIRELRTRSAEIARPAGMVTFEPSPQVVMHQEFPFILTPLAEKQVRLAALGLDFFYVIRFDATLRAMTALDFLEQRIIDPLRPSLIVVGDDHRFGSDRQGDVLLLAAHQARHGYELRAVPEQVHDGAAIKSTRIRERLVMGAVAPAAELLGYPYAITGRVVKGRGIGRGLGFPTINIEPDAPEKLIPAPGVYAVRAMRNAESGGWQPGVMNIGFRPTFAGRQQSIEVNLLDFQGDLYGARVTVEFVERLRPEIKFNSVEDLKHQIRADTVLARLVLDDTRRQQS